MSARRRFAGCPETLSQGSGREEVHWQLDPASAARRDDSVGDRYSLVATEDADDDCYPVYRQRPGTAPAVATGRLFLRLHDGHSMQSFAPALEALGLAVVHAPKWAPNTAWVAAMDSGPCHTLNLLGALLQTQNVAHVEAQLMLELHRR